MHYGDDEIWVRIIQTFQNVSFRFKRREAQTKATNEWLLLRAPYTSGKVDWWRWCQLTSKQMEDDLGQIIEWKEWTVCEIQHAVFWLNQSTKNKTGKKSCFTQVWLRQLQLRSSLSVFHSVFTWVCILCW